MNVFNLATGASPAWSSAGCYTDASTRILRGTYVRQSGMTTDICVNMCTSTGYTMAATEDGGECFCGSQFYKENGAGTVAASSQCSTPCNGMSLCSKVDSCKNDSSTGNSAQFCGGAWRANVYLAPGTTI